ncbi:sensor histidine kinase [Anaeromicropila populeti]|uniref:histidine kinase n=1 Tax=Anaeromicropila populeti TaxID=37658 RepID=A0A1I6IKD2_9FIRM|nr:HAMP domain-containing sensor histidine kinase [Anaeromicropila populeti]SFR67124.1 Signal transduction histidine kinase [Anaeromicropila populeti]
MDNSKWKERLRNFMVFKDSLRMRLMLTLTAFIALVVFACWIVNIWLLPSYYKASKINSLVDGFNQVNNLLQLADDTENTTVLDDDEISIKVERIEANNNLNLYLIGENLLSFSIQDRFYYIYPFNVLSNTSDRQKQQIYENFIDYWKKHQGFVVRPEQGRDLLEQSENFEIYKRYDERMQSNYIELIGVLDCGNYIYLRANYESMKESIHISNQFLAYIGIIVALISTIIMFFLSKNFTKPILDLSEIAERMVDLDFTAKYEEERNDEIGILGNGINTLSNKLEHTISELKTANNELKTDIERKIQIDEMRKEFLSNVSHELKTPIALIQGYAEGLIENVNDDAESRNFYCEVISDEANKMNKMVKKLLTLNQIEFGNNMAQIEHFDIVQMIKSVIASVGILVQQKGVRLLFEASSPIYVWSDEYMVEEVFTNYISNALNHVDGEKVIHIKLVKKQDTLRVSVFNTGKQIPQEDLEKIWIKFYKVDKARTREYGGNGIGLSIVSAVMKSLNHDFGVINHNNGVEFWFEVDINNKN